MPSKKKAVTTPAEKVIVNSKAYGMHERAPRGSKSRAVLNPAMKAHGRRLRKSNIPAKLIMDALLPFRENFKGGMLWQRLVKHFAMQAKEGDAYSVSGIGDWDLNVQYLTSRIMTVKVKIMPDHDFSNLEVEANYTFSKRFLKGNQISRLSESRSFFYFPISGKMKLKRFLLCCLINY